RPDVTKAGAAGDGLYARRRAEILEAAIQSFGEKGFQATTMVGIARRVGMSVGNLYNYFPGKDAIIAELASQMIARLIEQTRQTRQGEDGGEGFESILEVVRQRLDPVGARITAEIMAESLHNEKLRAVILDFNERRKAILLPLYCRRLQLPGDEAMMALESDMALLDGLGQRVLCGGAVDSDKLARQAARDLVRRFG
ncbi:MAG: TetR family transcriptional regulator, partial [Duodenibacillus sp.]|nr:TetR family transcriptional regulator [Duodenibacillus sp.]